MSILPSTNAALPNSYYFALADSKALEPQVLSLVGNTLSLSNGGGSVNVAAAPSVALSTNKLTATSYVPITNSTTFTGPIAAPTVTATDLLIDTGMPPFVNVGDSLAALSTAVGTLETNTTGITYDTGTTVITGDLNVTAIPPAVSAYPAVLGYNTVTGAIEYQNAGSSAGIAAVIAGSNIAVDNTIPTAPTVSVAISSTLDMSGQDISNAGLITASGDITTERNFIAIETATNTQPRIEFQDTTGFGHAEVGWNAGTDLMKIGAYALTAYTYNNQFSMTMRPADGYINTVARDSSVRTEIQDAAGANTETIMTASVGGVVTLEAPVTDKPIMRFNTTIGNVDVAPVPGVSGYNAMEMTNAQQLQVWTGAAEGVQMGMTNSVGYENYFRGMGLPLRVAQDSTREATEYMLFDTYGDGTGGIVINTTEYMDINSGRDARITSNTGIRMSVPNETTVNVLPSGILAIDNTGLISGNDPILSLKSLSGGEARIKRTDTGPLQINNDGDAIQLQVGTVTTAKINASGNVAVGGSGNDGSLFLVKGDETDYASINYTGGSDTLNIQAENITTAANSLVTIQNAVDSIVLDKVTDTITLRTHLADATPNSIVLSSGLDINCLDTITVANTGDISLYTAHPTAIAVIGTGHTSVTLDEANSKIALNSSGTIELTAPTGGIICDGILAPNTGIADQAASVGNDGQVLSSTGAGLIWSDITLFRPTGQWYVAPNGTDTTTSGTPLKPYQTIAYAISQVETAGSSGIINIAAGSYAGNLTITKNIQLVGTPTFQANEDSETPDPYVEISGNITYAPTTAITATSLNNMKIVGRIIHTVAVNVALSINNCLISKNVTGKFITVNTGSLVITESVIKNTSALGFGNYLINCPNSTPVTIFNTRATGNGTGILNGSSTIKLSGCVFTNTATGGTAIYAELGTINLTSTIKECVFNLNAGTALTYVVDAVNAMTLDSNEFNSVASSLINNSGAAVLTITLQRPNTCANGSTVIIDPTNITVINSRTVGDVYASFSSTASQTQTAANTPKVITYDTTDIASGDVSVSGSHIIVAQTGTYRIQTNIQFDTTSTGGSHYGVFWLRINGSDVANTSSRITLATNTSAILGVAEYIVNMTAGQYAEIVFASPDVNFQAIAYPATTGTPPTGFNSPANPSIITTIQRVA